MGDQLTDLACALRSATVQPGKLGRSQLAVPKQPAPLPLCPTLPTSLPPTLQSDKRIPFPFSFRVRPFGFFPSTQPMTDSGLPSGLTLRTPRGSNRAYPALDLLDRPRVRAQPHRPVAGAQGDQAAVVGMGERGMPGLPAPLVAAAAPIPLSTAIRGAPGDRDVHPSRVFAPERHVSPHTGAPRPSRLAGHVACSNPQAGHVTAAVALAAAAADWRAGAE